MLHAVNKLAKHFLNMFRTSLAVGNIVLRKFGGCLGCLGGIFVIFCEDLGGKHRGHLEGTKQMFLIVQYVCD